VEHTPLAMIEWNTQFHVTAWNQAAERIFGHAKEDVLGRNALTLLVREDARETINRDWLALMLQQGGTTGHYDNVTKDGRAIVCEWSNTPLVDAGGRVVGIASLVQDVTERRQTEETIRHMAHHDSLTGLANRRLLKDRLEQAIFHTRRGARHLAVVSLDLDRFKLINDTLGHAAGDGVLREIASRLCACVREGDTVSRDGGDEFVIVLSDLNQPADAERVLDKIKRELARPFSVNEHEFHVTPSIGVSFSPSDGADPELLLKHAGAALHAAKEGGRNTQRVYTAGVKSLLDQRLAIETRLRRGLERNEFLLHYQPQIELSSGRISGSESLVRWRESGQGKEMFPSEFIPIAEEMGVIAALGEWVLATACEQLKRWHELGFPHLHISVNLSPRQFLARNLLDNVKRVLVHTGVNPVNLELEITESMIMSNPERASEVLQELRAMGVQLAIDDFGTGHSSLSHLKRFPVHTLKIDPSFVRGVPHGQEDSAITQAIVAMARSLRLRVVAEGVENKAQLDYLRALGCDAVQGYLFSRPLPAAEFAALLHAEPGSLSTLLAISPSEPAPV
jgi:diguanylate cyclase (GGDEF)-like protein/PAS domain S-box-containing protein